MANKNLFNSIKVASPNYNSFDLTHDVKMSLQLGKLYPNCVIEAVPGDKFNISAESLLRFAPLVSPVMHRMDVTMHYFFVPNRLLWDEWETFISSDPATAPAPPTIQLTSVNAGIKSLANYLGCPLIDNPNSYNVNALPFSAYQCIYSEFYRDQNLIGETDYKVISGNNTLNLAELIELHRRAWEHDYFTSALPFAQKGSEVTLPLVLDDAPVAMKQAGVDPASGFLGVQSSFGPGSTNMNVEAIGANDPDHQTVGNNIFFANNENVTSSTNINDLRRAFRLQEWLEKMMRGGSRYIEQIKAHFGILSSDRRLQRPEYITGVKSPVVISEVLNTTGESAGLPQGNMAGHAVSVASGNYGSYFCEEHGYIIGIMSVMPKTAYQQGLPRHFTKDSPLDFYFPSFAHLGEQEIKQKEIFINSLTPDATFGYIPRYAEYKFQSNRVAGDFQDDLDFWHLGRIFASDPALNQAFIECNPSRRIFAVTDPDEDVLYAHVLNKIRALRKMPVYGTPTF